jgi:chaperone LolA
MLWFTLVAAHAAEPAADPNAAALKGVLSALSTKYGPADVIRGSFTQTTKNAYGDQVQQGTVVLKRPGKIRWESGPDGKQIVCDGSTLWYYDPAEKQVLRMKNVGEQAASSYAVLQSMDKLGDLFAVQLVSGDVSHGFELLLRPKDGQDAQFKQIVVDVDAKTNLDVVKVTDPFDSVTTIDFTQLSLGGSADDKTFTFQVPSGVAVVDAG